MRRNRGQVAAAALVVLALVVGVLGTTLGLIEARRQERIALSEALAKEKARAAEAEQRAKAETLRQQAEKRLTQVDKMNEILGSIFNDLNPKKIEADGKALSVVLGERLEAAAAAIEGEATGDPVAVARMQLRLGQSLIALGYAVKAIDLFTKARATFTQILGPEHPDTLSSMGNLANSYSDAGQFDRALRLREETLVLMKAKLGPDHPDTLVSMGNLATNYGYLGQFDRALRLLEEALVLMKVKLGPDHPETLMCMFSLGAGYSITGQSDRAIKLEEEALALRKAKLGPDHPDTLASMGNLAITYSSAGQIARAIQLGEETLALRKAKLGPDHPNTLTSMNNLADSYSIAGQIDRALKLNEETLAALKAKLGPDHPITLASMTNLAKSYFDAGQFNKALKLREGRLTLTKAKLGPDHPDTVAVETALATFHLDFGDPALAEPLFRGIVDRARRSPINRSSLENGLANLGRALLKLKKWTEAETVLREILQIRETANPDAWTTFNTRSMLGGSVLGQGKMAEAEPLLRSGYEGMAKRADKIPAPGKIRLAEALDRLIEFGEATGKAEEVKAWKLERAKLDAAKVVPRPEADKK